MLHTIINNRYQLQHELGSGGMGTVYRAYDRLRQTEVAIKRLNVPAEFFAFMGMDSSSDMMLSLAHEFETLAGLRHPNIISVLDYGFDAAKNPYLVEEYLAHAHPLTRYARGKPEAAMVRLIIQLLQALAYLHRRGILHRDIKPENVLVVDGRVKVLDFGLAGARGQDTETIGTLGYLAPEVIRQHHFSEASDLYAVGVIAYQALAGKLPLAAPSMDDMVLCILNQTPEVAELAVSPALQAAIARLLAKDPAARPADAAEAMEIFAATIGETLAESAAIRESFLQAATFVGREAELAELKDALSAASKGRGGLWLVGGESGVGKTRLLDELRTRALVQGMQVVRGQGVDEGGLPYQLWRGVMRRLALGTELADTEASVLQSVVPDLDRLLERELPPLPPLESEAAQQRLVITMGEVLRRQPRPLLVLLEDLHWADESMELLKHLAGIITDRPLLMVASYQSDEAPDLPDQLPAANLLLLERLPSRAIAELSTSMLGGAGRHEQVVDLLSRETEGNVFFVVEVLRALAEEAGSLEDIATMSLPQRVMAGGVQRIIRRRLAKVPPADQPLLKTAAIAGRQLDLALLRHLAPDRDLDTWLSNSASVAVLETRQAGWQFSHQKLREALLADLAAEEQQALHRQVAQGIEAVYPEDPDYAATLADHWGHAGDEAQEARYARLAGERALEVNTPAAAVARLERALALTAEKDKRTRVVLLGHLGRAHQQLSNFQTAREYIQHSLELAMEADDQRGVAMSHFGLGRLLYFEAEFPAARTHFQTALGLFQAQEAEAWEAHTLVELSNVAIRLNDLPQATPLLQNGLAIARRLENLALEEVCLSGLGVIQAERDDYAAAIPYYQQAIELSRQIGDRYALGRSLMNIGRAQMELTNFAEADRYYAEAQQIFEEIGNRYAAAVTLHNRGDMAHRQKDFDTAEKHIQHSLAISRDIDSPYVVAVNLINLGDIARERGRFVEAESYFQECLAIRREIGDQRGAANVLNHLGTLSREQADRPQARRYLREGLALVQHLEAPIVTLDILREFAQLDIEEGQLASGLELLGFILSQPAENLPFKTELDALLAMASRELPDAEMDQYLETGRTRQLPNVIAELLKEETA